MNRLMMTLCTVGMVFVSSHSYALEREEIKKICIANVKNFWKARREQDVEAVVSLLSPSGVYTTASDGSFHKPKRMETVERERNFLAQTQVNFQVYFPEAVLLSKDVVLTRYYLEGLLTSAGKTSPYRTRVTQIWVNEKGQWLAKSAPFSSASYGGVYLTQPADYDRD